MIIKPRIRKNVCTNAHPLGCADQVQAQIDYVQARDQITSPKKVLVIGAAKKDLEQKTEEINTMLSSVAGKALISANKALVTRASAVIPIVPLYIALLYRIMKSKKLHEGCIQQMYRLYHDFLFTGNPPSSDEKDRIRIDDWEMREDVQKEVAKLWQMVDSDNLKELTDIKGMREEFLRHHGFGIPGVDYDQDVRPDIF